MFEIGMVWYFHSIYERSSNYENIILRFKPFDFDNEKIIELRELISDSIWFNFFRKEFEIDTWIDFENKIEYVLKILFSATEHIQERIFSNGSILKAKTEDLYFRDIIFNRNVEIIQVLYRFNLIEIYGENFRFNQDFLIEKYNIQEVHFQYPDEKRLYDEFKELKKKSSIAVKAFDSEHFYCSLQELAEFGKEKKPFRKDPRNVSGAFQREIASPDLISAVIISQGSCLGSSRGKAAPIPPNIFTKAIWFPSGDQVGFR